jgi:hypothetical protein
MMFTLNPAHPTVISPAFLYIVPTSDALRYRLFEAVHLCNLEFGTAADSPDPAGLARYSPCHQFHGGVPYSDVMIISDGREMNSKLFHERKASGPFHKADSSACVVLFDDPFTDRRTARPLRALTEAVLGRMELLSDQLQVSV